jgi:hypothetical protein
VGLLRSAAQLEHALCLQYLYAAFTLKSGGEEGMTAAQAALNESWDQQITRVGIQEMYHLMLASNLLTCLGEVPELGRPPFPQPGGTFSGINQPLTLSPFSYEAVSRFMCWEKPSTDKPDPWWDPFCAACADAARGRLNLVAAQEAQYETIGQLYDIIKAGFVAHPEWIDPATAPRQVTSALVPFSPAVGPITTADEAACYIDIIVREGEGAPDWQSTSHFAYFHQIVAQLESLNDTGATSTASWTTVDNPVYEPGGGGPGRSVIDDPDTVEVGRLANALYLVLVRMLVRLFIPEGESEAERQALANAAMAVMPLGLKPLAIQLTSLPAGPAFPGRFAGPSFELPDDVPLPAGAREEALPALAAELLAVTKRCRVLTITAVGLSPAVRQNLGTIAARLETILPLLSLQGEPAGVSR